MPICDNNNKPTPIVTADVDHQAEIAKAKISREQAYFNSYDFDAIEVVPLDENDPICDSIKETPDAAAADGSDLGHQALPSGVYLKRLTSYFAASTRIRGDPNNKLHQTTPSASTTVIDIVDEDSRSDRSSSGSSSRNSSRKLYTKTCSDDNNHEVRNSFSLPRAMLKYQSALAATSISAAGLATCNATINKATAIASSKTNQRGRIYDSQKRPIPGSNNSGFVQCYDKSGACERIISSSHYSTDKSGSSGYYSSNVCSTSSVEEHIYSEPVVDIIGTRLAPLKQLSIPLQRTLEKQPQGSVRALAPTSRGSYYNVQVHNSEITEELRLLETSIENLDRHLKSYPGLDSFSPRSSSCTVYDDVNSVQTYDKAKCPQPMPTIMEGTDGQSPAKTSASWSEEMDDSLMDIDLDSFLLVNEVGTKSSNATKSLSGIDNPTFNKTKVLHEEVLENNYKCSKYVNSCPEDAYKVESVIDPLVHGTGLDSPDKSLMFFLKKYEDQIHFQSTKDMLEDIRNKVNSLTNNSSDSCPTIGQPQIPKDLEKHIALLKVELESYLQVMNYSNELEIKQLCTGLVKDQKLMTITKAFERRKSLASDYEPIRTSSYAGLPYSKSDLDDTGSVACSDPNFKLKRKSIEDIRTIGINHYPIVNNDDFGDADGGVEKSAISSGSDPDGKTVLNVTQLQKNLSFQRPMLDRRNKGEGDKDTMIEWHKNKPSIWELYYGTNRINQKLAGKRGPLMKNTPSILSYPSTRPESDFTLDLPKAEQLRLKMEKEKKFRQRCRILTSFLSLVFFLLTVMVVSLILTRGKRMFGSML